MNDLSILVITCDKYSDLWEAFFELKERNWPDCIYPVYLGTNKKSYANHGVISICIGEDKSWTENVRNMLEFIDSSYILVLLEDFFIDRKVNSTYIKKLLEFMKEENLDCLRLEPQPAPVKCYNRKLKVGRIAPGSPYYVSTQPAIWRKEILKELLIPSYSAWDFEMKNSAKSKTFIYQFGGGKKICSSSSECCGKR